MNGAELSQDVENGDEERGAPILFDPKKRTIGIFALIPDDGHDLRTAIGGA